ncbi:MAG: sulfurtransferase TusA family protein [Alphaproteobacteria bacterium]|nr:sulfurtransferase TusA family protein [Alphaproteobacteria bacterium]
METTQAFCSIFINTEKIVLLMADKSLDTKGMKCPLPVLRTSKVLKDMASGETLEVLATDPMAQRDIKVLCEEKGHRFLSCTETDDITTVLIQKG